MVLSLISKKLEIEGLGELQEVGVKVYIVFQVPQETLYVPAGWLLFERSVRGTVLAGVRKSCFIQNSDCEDMYKAAMTTLAGDAQNVDKMKAVLALLS